MPGISAGQKTVAESVLVGIAAVSIHLLRLPRAYLEATKRKDSAARILLLRTAQAVARAFNARTRTMRRITRIAHALTATMINCPILFHVIDYADYLRTL